MVAPTWKRGTVIDEASGETVRATRDPARIAAAELLADAIVHNDAIDRLTRLAARVVSSPYASASVFTDRQIIASRHGFEEVPTSSVDSDLPADAVTMCELLVNSGGPLVVGDAANDRRFRDVAAVRNGFVGSYLGVPLSAATGEIIGALCVFESSPRDWSEDDLEALQDVAGSLDASAQRDAAAATTKQIAHVLETMTGGFFAVDRNWLITYVNKEAESLLGLTTADLIGQSLWSAFPEQVGRHADTAYRRAIETGEPAFFEEYFAPTQSWFEVRAWPSADGLSVYFHDITQRRLAEDARTRALAEVQRANDRLRFVTDLSARLAGQLSRRDVLEVLASAVVPDLADWCTINVPHAGTELNRVAAAHRERGLDALAKRLVGTYPHPYDGPSPGVAAYLEKQPVHKQRLVTSIIADLDDSDASAAYARTLTLLGDGPGLVVPVLIRDDVAAVMTLVRVGDREFSPEDVTLIMDVATRVAAGLEAARYAEQQREVAGALQAVALPERLPDKGRLKLAAGYRPASEGADVGGDWYDAFELPDGTLALAVGDAAGHGLRAAAIMGQLRNALRGYLFDGCGPAGSLRRLDRLLAALEPDAFATVVCATLDPSTGRGLWASAGHPPPVLVGGTGTASALPGEPTPPLGIGHANAAREYPLILVPGDRLVLYTDGLIERRHSDIEVGLAHLQITAEQLRFETDTNKACKAILDDMLAGDHDDDVCVLLADMTEANADA